jgi:hypothetical protein
MLRLGEFASESYRGCLVRLGSAFWRSIPTQTVFYAAALDFCAPAVGRRFPHAFESASVVNWRFAVMQVLGRRGFSQIRPSVVGRFAVNVINFMSRPLACHKKPDEPVRVIMFSIDNNSYVSVFGKRACFISALFEIGRRLPVIEPARVKAVFKQFAYSFCCEIGVSVFVPASHHQGTLAQMPLLVN